MRSFKSNVFLKIGAITLVVLLLFIPTLMIEGLIHEREYTQDSAISEVSSKWSESQTISGPIISIPYIRYESKLLVKDSVKSLSVEVKDYIHILPSELKISGEINPERRYRGIYEVVVYNSHLNFEGKFCGINLSGLGIPKKDIMFDQAILSLGISDLRGIEKQVSMKWSGDSLYFDPGLPTNSVLSSGINVPIKLDFSEDKQCEFFFSLDLKGSQKLFFTPVGANTDIQISSPWENPAFDGAFLPDSWSKIENGGFLAEWNVLHINRNYPQIWIGSSQSIDSADFGVYLKIPVDNYQKTTRAIKYAILFIVFTFMVFFFTEVMRRRFIHPLQYLLVGLALVIFYTLLLSISEYMSFNFAFFISAFATMILIGGYIWSIIKSKYITMLIVGLLLVLYTFIFIIIQLQDYALLIGSVGLFAILGSVMYISRKIDWYNVKLGE